MAITPPEHISTQKSGEGTGDKTLEIEVQEGDLILLAAEGESCQGAPDWEVSEKAGLEWTTVADQSHATFEAEPDKQASQEVLKAVATETKKITVKLHQVGGISMRWIAVAQVWRKHNGVGAVKTADNKVESGTPTATLTTESEHSALTAMVNDWNEEPATATWAGSETQALNFDYGGAFTTHWAYFPDEGEAGSKTVTEETPATQRYRIAVIEIKGLAEETPQELTPDEDLATTGWTETPLFSKLNDASDATVVKATLA